MNNLDFFCKNFKWQGGTIHQVSEELRSVGLSKELTEISSLIEMNENARNLLIDLYKVKASNEDDDYYDRCDDCGSRKPLDSKCRC